MKASKVQADEKKIVFAASLPDMPVKTFFFFVRDRCPYVGRDAALGKYPANSESKICE